MGNQLGMLTLLEIPLLQNMFHLVRYTMENQIQCLGKNHVKGKKIEIILHNETFPVKKILLVDGTGNNTFWRIQREF